MKQNEINLDTAMLDMAAMALDGAAVATKATVLLTADTLVDAALLLLRKALVPGRTNADEDKQLAGLVGVVAAYPTHGRDWPAELSAAATIVWCVSAKVRARARKPVAA